MDTPTRDDQVTVTATGTPTPLAQSGAPITVLAQAQDYPHAAMVEQPLRLVPGVQLTANGQTGGVTSLFIRGGESNATKVLVDGVPLNDVGGAVNFANIATVGLSQVEVLRQPNSALYGSDALAGVVSLTTARGTTPLPRLTYAIDGGNLGLLHHQAELGGAQGRFDYYTGFARLNTQNDEPANAYHNVSFAGNYGYAPDSRTDLRFIFRHAVSNGAQPNALDFFGIADAAGQKEQRTLLSGTLSQQTTARWHNLLRYGHEALASQSYEYATTGTPYYSYGYLNGYIGNPVTITGANGYTVSGQAILQYPGTYPNVALSTANRDFVYAQTDYQLNPHLNALGAFRYEAERGSSYYSSLSTVDRGNYSYTLQLAGDAKSRLFYTLGSGVEDNAVFGKALTPRASLAYYAVRPASDRFFSGTKLHASFGKGIKESSVAQQNGSLYGVLAQQSGGAALIAQYGVTPLGAEYSRTYDVGVEQQLGNGRARINVTWFHNQFTNGIQYVPNQALIELGIPAAGASQFQYGAYVNALAERSEGAELESEVRLSSRLFARAGYTYLDGLVQRSFSSDALSPSYNTSFNFSSVPIGAYGPLDGARPFRRSPHSGYFALAYAHDRLQAQLAGTLVGSRDDSTYLSDKDYGTSLLLPNRNLDGAYQNLRLDGEYRINSHVSTYAQINNLLNESYYEAFGYRALPFTVRGGFRFTLGGESWRLR